MPEKGTVITITSNDGALVQRKTLVKHDGTEYVSRVDGSFLLPETKENSLILDIEASFSDGGKIFVQKQVSVPTLSCNTSLKNQQMYGFLCKNVSPEIEISGKYSGETKKYQYGRTLSSVVSERYVPANQNTATAFCETQGMSFVRYTASPHLSPVLTVNIGKTKVSSNGTSYTWIENPYPVSAYMLDKVFCQEKNFVWE